MRTTVKLSLRRTPSPAPAQVVNTILASFILFSAFFISFGSSVGLPPIRASTVYRLTLSPTYILLSDSFLRISLFTDLAMVCSGSYHCLVRKPPPDGILLSKPLQYVVYGYKDSVLH
jgi:hypothetical protein